MSHVQPVALWGTLGNPDHQRRSNHRVRVPSVGLSGGYRRQHKRHPCVGARLTERVASHLAALRRADPLERHRRLDEAAGFPHPLVDWHPLRNHQLLRGRFIDDLRFDVFKGLHHTAETPSSFLPVRHLQSVGLMVGYFRLLSRPEKPAHARLQRVQRLYSLDSPPTLPYPTLPYPTRPYPTLCYHPTLPSLPYLPALGVGSVLFGKES